MENSNNKPAKSLLNKKKAEQGFAAMSASDIQAERRSMIGNKLSFSASEAYKLLRTNITFSFTEQEGCRKIGVTSSLKGEGKSITAINLAYSLAETGKRVLLMECDLRIPTLAKRMQLIHTPGLSNVLVGMNSVHEVIHEYKHLSNLKIIVAGTIPPNPSELLGSAHMTGVLEYLSSMFDYIIVDLPPVTAVSDALVVSKLVDGMVLVVRSDYAEKSGVDDTVRQLRFVNARILGFVFNGSQEAAGGYGKRYKSYAYRKTHAYKTN